VGNISRYRNRKAISDSNSSVPSSKNFDQWDCITLKRLCIAKQRMNRMKRQLTNGRKCLPDIHPTKD
jgi:hypothetical protein